MSASLHPQPRSPRERNRLQVIDLLRRHGSASRGDIARGTGLSRATVSSLVAELLHSGLLVERGEARRHPGANGGRPPVLLTLGPGAGGALAVDFGHTHLRVAVAELSGRVLAERRSELDVDRLAGEGLDAAAALVDDVLREAGLERERLLGVGMGLPGPIDRRTGVIGSSVILPGWAGLRPADELGRRLDMPVEVDNDANLGALGELTFGAAHGARDVVYVKISSGIGAGLIIAGRLHHGTIGIAGELGHFQLDSEGPVCRCGNRGCLETRAAAPALVELLRRSHGADLTVQRMLDLAREGDPGCRRVLEDAGRAVGHALADVCNLLNPELVVVGGELSAAGQPLLDGLRESIRRFALPAAADAVEVRTGVLAERAELLGALALVIRDTGRISSAALAA